MKRGSKDLAEALDAGSQRALHDRRKTVKPEDVSTGE